MEHWYNYRELIMPDDFTKEELLDLEKEIQKELDKNAVIKDNEIHNKKLLVIASTVR